MTNLGHESRSCVSKCDAHRMIACCPLPLGVCGAGSFPAMTEIPEDMASGKQHHPPSLLPLVPRAEVSLTAPMWHSVAPQHRGSSHKVSWGELWWNQAKSASSLCLEQHPAPSKRFIYTAPSEQLLGSPHQCVPTCSLNKC